MLNHFSPPPFFSHKKKICHSISLFITWWRFTGIFLEPLELQNQIIKCNRGDFFFIKEWNLSVASSLFLHLFQFFSLLFFSFYLSLSSLYNIHLIFFSLFIPIILPFFNLTLAFQHVARLMFCYLDKKRTILFISPFEWKIKEKKTNWWGKLIKSWMKRWKEIIRQWTDARKE